MRKKIVAGFALALLPALAMAHPGHGDGGFASALAHPFTGADHLLMMLFVGAGIIVAMRLPHAVRQSIAYWERRWP